MIVKFIIPWLYMHITEFDHSSPEPFLSFPFPFPSPLFTTSKLSTGGLWVYLDLLHTKETISFLYGRVSYAIVLV